MPYANNDGVRIYYEVEGEGPPLVLMYGICHRFLYGICWATSSHLGATSGSSWLIRAVTAPATSHTTQKRTGVRFWWGTSSQCSTI